MYNVYGIQDLCFVFYIFINYLKHSKCASMCFFSMPSWYFRILLTDTIFLFWNVVVVVCKVYFCAKYYFIVFVTCADAMQKDLSKTKKIWKL